MAVVTYCRPNELGRTISSVRRATSVAETQGHRIRLVVVDNDPAGSAEQVCQHAKVGYIPESRPGIPAARNAALIERRRDEALAFIDDDEIASENWLTELLAQLDRSSADAVFGPVLPILPPSAPLWIVRGAFFDRLSHSEGDTPRHPATNNVLIAPKALARVPDARFDLAFTSSGGSDTDFFMRLSAAGAVFSWAPRATVDEVVPETRATLGWLWRRNIRLGNMTARIRYPGHARSIMVLAGSIRIILGIVLMLLDVVRLRSIRAKSVTHIPKGLGMARSAVGINYSEYQRRENA